MQFVTNAGQLSAQVPVAATGRTSTGAITGGTDAYDGARGHGTAKNVNKNTTKVTINLLS